MRRHSGALARVAHIGADVAERLASVARRQLVNRQGEANSGVTLVSGPNQCLNRMIVVSERGGVADDGPTQGRDLSTMTGAPGRTS